MVGVDDGGRGKTIPITPPIPSPSFRPSLSHLVQNYYFPQPSTAVKIKDDASYNFHQENTVHSLLQILHALRVSPSFWHMANETLFPDYLHYKETSYHDPLQKTHRSGMASHPQGYQVSAELPVGEKTPINHQKKSIAQDKLIWVILVMFDIFTPSHQYAYSPYCSLYIS